MRPRHLGELSPLTLLRRINPKIIRRAYPVDVLVQLRIRGLTQPRPKLELGRNMKSFLAGHLLPPAFSLSPWENVLCNTLPTIFQPSALNAPIMCSCEVTPWKYEI